jgi:ABC-type sugar transport system ATPase subunit
MVPESAPALLEVWGMTKSFPGVQALVNVDLDVRAGEVHASSAKTAPVSQR